MKEQRRAQPRINYSAHALVTTGTGETVKGLIRDISTESIYLYIDPIFKINCPVNIEIILLGANSQLAIKMPAKVARKDQNGVAMIFFTPLEWWPVFNYFSAHNLDCTTGQQDADRALKTHPRKSPAAFQGDLSIITIENLMQLVSHAALSGELQLSTPGNSAIFYVHQGILVYGYLEKNPMKIGQRLLEANYITKEHLQECLLICQKQNPRPKIGKILVEKGYLKQEQLEKIIKELIKAIFFEVLSWKEGFFTFSIKKIPSGERTLLDERIDHLILAGLIYLEN